MSALFHRVCTLTRTTALCRVRSTAITANSDSEPSLVPVLEDDEAKELAEQIHRRRNKSRLNEPHFNEINGRRPYNEPYCLAHLTVKYNRKLYGKYGAASGVNPTICWPTKKDIKETKEYERVAFPFTIEEVAKQVMQKREEQKRAIAEREESILLKLTKMEQWKKELNDKINKKTQDAKAAKEKKERLVEEVRRHFGFKLDPHDERFQEMLVKREREQKKQEKMARREAKEKEMLAKLQMKSAAISDTSNEEAKS